MDLAVQTQLADSGLGALWLIAAGAVLVAVIVLAFVLGQRAKDREPPPTGMHRRRRRR
ncbi:ABC-type polysaccharide/polyol phosphate export permease [Kitasatospora gansuensis]|uniref:ABC-type polysaccharide/polyol phosphate export permease n=1 Tax=Kitasatospora gansuensis TaxID=258050 RepID=A0A7W7WKY4_9ACTN|nr:DUF6479 family protein [Kitasatospora gansuensis]MBB4950475.1 ABC-type polysaccharide/polyol phosphate export permease [Kitasatospora gansuensis]